MGYTDIAAMASNTSLINRLSACASTQANISNPVAWVSTNIWKLVSQPGWDTKWRYAVDNYTEDFNPDHGIRPGVISDADILSAVQAVAALP